MKNKWASTIGILGLCTVLTLPAYAAETVSKPETHHHENSISGFISHSELQKTLSKIEAASKGIVQVEVAGQSHNGLDIYTATVGTGDKVILVQSEIHGNEKTGTVALLNLLVEAAVLALGSRHSGLADRLGEAGA